MMTKLHSFTYLQPSVLPIISSMSSLSFVISAIMLVKYQNILMFISSILVMALCAFLWWSLYLEEMNSEGTYSYPLSQCLKTSMVLFISSEVFFFFSFFWSYFNYSLTPCVEMNLSWPPQGILFFDPMDLPLANTFILLLSGITVTSSHFYLMANNYSYFLNYLLITSVLGILFTLCQFMEYSNSFFSLNDSVFGTTFFVLTGFHGIHVLIGTMFLSYVLLEMSSNKVSSETSVMFELASWYWHFVDVVWIFLYFFLYYIPSDYF